MSMLTPLTGAYVAPYAALDVDNSGDDDNIGVVTSMIYSLLSRFLPAID